MKYIVIPFQLLMAGLFLTAIASGNMSGTENTIAVAFIVGIVLSVMHVARGKA